MNYRIAFRLEAWVEFIQAYKWYESEMKGLGERFMSVVEKRLDQIADNPHHFHISKGKYRAAVTEVFPYLIVFKINNKKKAVLISAIHHKKRNPRHKYRR